VIAGPGALDRALIRHFLEGEGFDVVGEAGGFEELVRAADELVPDAVIVDGRILAGARVDLGVVRSAALDASVVVVADERLDASAIGADAVVERGAGLAQLATTVGWLNAVASWRPGEGATISAGILELAHPATPPPRATIPEATAVPSAAVGRRRVRPPRLLAVAALALVGVLLLGLLAVAVDFPTRRVAEPPTVGPVAPPITVRILGDGREYRAAARAYLRELVVAMRQGERSRVTRLARKLLVARSLAVGNGVSVDRLDTRVRERVPRLLDSVEPRTALHVAAILRPLLPPVEIPPEPTEPTEPPTVTASTPPPASPPPTSPPTPTPTQPPSPEPTETPSAEPTETPSPEPTETPSPEPTETPSPEPTETPSPEPTETPTPEPTDSPTPAPSPCPSPSDTGA
jgi:DNA-binding NarL/FixJ family response regulator